MQNEVVKVNKQEVTVKEYKGQRVVTFKDVDHVHERPDGTARRTFNTNKEHLIEGEDYFVRNSYEAKEEYGVTAPNGLVLLTESGYLMLVKSFTDDLAWQVQRQLVKSYFGARRNELADLSNLSVELQAIIMHDKKIQRIETRMDKLEYDIPLYGSEADELCNHVKRKGVEMLGGKSSNAYADNKIRTAVYTDIYNQIKREFGLYDDKGHYKSYKALKRRYIYKAHEVIDAYELPLYLNETITDCNAQLTLNGEVA